MSFKRRQFLKATLATGAIGSGIGGLAGCSEPAADSELPSRLLSAASAPVLRRDRLSDPVIIDSVELLHKGKQFFVRVSSTDGAVGLAMTNQRMIRHTYPMFLRMIAPFFVGKDARDLEQLVDGVFTHRLNYKWQGLAFWVCVGWMEFAVLDLLGRRFGLSVGQLLGDRMRESSKIYYANGDRTSEAARVVDQLEELIAISGAKAIKHKVGGRMHYTAETTARDRALVPLARERLGDETIIFTDANSSFDVPAALEIGELVQEHNYAFFEEPVRFDDFEATKAVSDALHIPVAGGEQESSMRRFRSLIEDNIVQVLQPDILNFGGFVRSIRVARMGEVVGKQVVPHMSGYGLGILHVLHFASVVPNALEFQEYKGDKDGIPYEVIGTGAPLQTVDGEIAIPSGPGLGVDFDPDFIKQMSPVVLV